MKKKHLVYAGILLAGGITALLIHWRADRPQKPRAPVTEEEVIAQAARAHGPAAARAQPAPARIDPARPIRLAAGCLGLADDDQNRRLADLIVAELSGTPGLECVERDALDAILREMQLSLSGLVRARDAVRVGRLLRADWFLLGTAARIHGTNSIVLRIVDARTGILRDAGVFFEDKASPQFAAELAGFVRHCRQTAAEGRPPTYLAIGLFEDVGLNTRQAEFSTLLRSYLTAAYQNANVTLLERQSAGILFQETQLDLAGMTDEGATNVPSSMLSAYWLVDGWYQSYESTNFQLELVLDVNRMFGRHQRKTLCGQQDDAFFREIKDTIDAIMARESTPLVFSRNTEARAQLQRANELVQFPPDLLQWSLIAERPRHVQQRLQRRMELAVQALESVLLLDPGNREAKYHMAYCLREAYPERIPEALGYYRQVLDAGVQDQWALKAKSALIDAFLYVDQEARASWFEAALKNSTSPHATEFYRKELQEARDETVLRGESIPEAQRLAEEKLFRTFRQWSEGLQKKRGASIDFGAMGLEDFAWFHRADPAMAAKRLAELLPKLQEIAPLVAPHLLAYAAGFQVDTNAAVLTEFKRSLQESTRHPERLYKPKSYFTLVSRRLYRHAEELQWHEFAVTLKESARTAADLCFADTPDHEDRMGLAFCYMATKRWKDALAIFECYSNQPVPLGNRGIWGPAFIPVDSASEASRCRRELGLPNPTDPRKFEMSPDCLVLPLPAAWTADAGGLWAAAGSQLLRLDFNLKTNLAVTMPKDRSTPIDCVCASPSHVWIGTVGEGLIAYDTAANRFQKIQERDGLLMNAIHRLDLCAASLSIGYHRGLGRLDLASGKLTSFMPSLISSAGMPEDRGSIGLAHAIATDPNGDIWYLLGKHLKRHRVRDGTWETVSRPGIQWHTALAASPRLLVAGFNSTIELSEVEITTRKPGGSWTNNVTRRRALVTLAEYTRLKQDLRTNQLQQITSDTRKDHFNIPRGGLDLHSFATGDWRSLPQVEGLTAEPTALRLAGGDLWVGGEGYIARVDPARAVLRNLAFARTEKVEQIEIAGGYLWAQYRCNQHCHLCRASLAELQ